MDYINTLKELGLVILDLTDKDIVIAMQKVKKYGLITAGAAHIAVMERKGIRHMASSDRDFNVVDNITVWLPD